VHWYYVLLIVVAALVLITLTMSVGVRVLYDEKLFLWIRVGPVKIRLLPAKKPKKKKGGTDKEKAAGKKKAKPKKKHSAAEIKTLVKELLPPAKKALSKAAGALRVDCLALRLTVGGESPAKAAERYGIANAAVWTAVPLLENACRIRRRDIDVSLDYGLRESKASGEIDLSIRLSAGIGIMFSAGIPVLRAVLKFTKSGKTTEDKKEKNEDKAA
jgi:hypothetical protein